MSSVKDNWIQTYSGGKFYPLHPKEDDIHIVDIAHALSLQCRFNGHCLCFYSVAEHSVKVSERVSNENALKALLHDAAEAYLGDIPRPIKPMIPQFREIEDNIQRAIFRRFGLTEDFPCEVKIADLRLLMNERKKLMPATSDKWYVDVPPFKWTGFMGWSAEQAEQEFMNRFLDLVRIKNGRNV